MSSLSRNAVAGLSLAGVLLMGAGKGSTGELRVCADPNNLPFSNQRGQGFENRIAAVLAKDLGAALRFTWWPERRGFLRKTLKAHRCDAVIGMPVGSPSILTTRPYYTSSYVFLSRRDRHLDIRSLDDDRLRHLRIGMHFIGDDYNNPPPAQALARRGIVRNVVGFSIYGDYSRPNPPAELVHAVAKGEVDVAIIWGPFAGYFSNREPVPLTVTPVSPAVDPPGLPFTFDIAVAVRPDDSALRSRLDAALARHAREIERILTEYRIPRANTARVASCTVAARQTRCG